MIVVFEESITIITVLIKCAETAQKLLIHKLIQQGNRKLLYYYYYLHYYIIIIIALSHMHSR